MLASPLANAFPSGTSDKYLSVQAEDARAYSLHDMGTRLSIALTLYL